MAVPAPGIAPGKSVDKLNLYVFVGSKSVTAASSGTIAHRRLPLQALLLLGRAKTPMKARLGHYAHQADVAKNLLLLYYKRVTLQM